MEENKEIFEEVYPYQVNTRMPITGLTIGTLKVPTTIKLTKDDVLTCMKKAPVFRRFSNGIKVRVSIGNIDRLHRAEFVSEEDYEKMIDKENDNRGKVEVVVEEKKETPVVEEEEPKVEEPVVEEVKEETTPEVPVVEEEVKEDVVQEEKEEVNDTEEVSEEVTEETAEVEEKSTEENNRYYSKKKHRR